MILRPTPRVAAAARVRHCVAARRRRLAVALLVAVAHARVAAQDDTRRTAAPQQRAQKATAACTRTSRRRWNSGPDFERAGAFFDAAPVYPFIGSTIDGGGLAVGPGFAREVRRHAAASTRTRRGRSGTTRRVDATLNAAAVRRQPRRVQVARQLARRAGRRVLRHRQRFARRRGTDSAIATTTVGVTGSRPGGAAVLTFGGGARRDAT